MRAGQPGQWLGDMARWAAFLLSLMVAMAFIYAFTAGVGCGPKACMDKQDPHPGEAYDPCAPMVIATNGR